MRRVTRAALVVLGSVFLATVALTQSMSADVALALAKCMQWDGQNRALCYEDAIPGLYPRHSIDEIFAAIRVLQPYDDALLDCHFLAHRLGETVVALDPSSWPQQLLAEGTETMCSFGYIHGITIAVYAGRTFSEEELEAEMPLLDRVCEDAALGSMVRRNCYHGLGHMLYYLANTDVERGFALCDRVAAGASERDEQHRRLCYAGVAMKLFLTLSGDEDPDWRRLTKETAPGFCASFEVERYRNACLRSSWIIFADELEDAPAIQRFCGMQDEKDAEYCFTKVFHGFAWKFIDEPERMKALCSQFEGKLNLLCHVDAAIERLVTSGGDPKRSGAIDMCDAAGEYSYRCHRQVALYGRFIHDEGDEREAYCARFAPDIERECLAAPYE